MFTFVTWTAMVAALLQGYSAKSVRLEVAFLRWKMSEDEVAKARFPLDVPKDTKAETSIEFDAPIGKEQHVETKVGNRTFRVVANVSGFSECGFLVRLSIEDRVDSDGLPSSLESVGTTLGIWPGQRSGPGGCASSTTIDGKTEAHGEAFTVKITRPLFPIAGPITVPVPAPAFLPVAGQIQVTAKSAPIQSPVTFPASGSSAGGCGTSACAPGAMTPISNGRR